MASVALTEDHVETQYGTRYVKIILKMSSLVSVTAIILSPWLIKAKIVPTIKATLIAL
jgi:hypothetical protein